MTDKECNNLFFDAILTLNTREELRDFLGDACTQKEINVIAQRFAVAKLLREKHVYNEIIEKTGASTATISRVSRSMTKGFERAFERLEK